MSVLHIIALVVSLVGLAAWFNSKFIKLPTAIGILLISSLISIGLVVLSRLGFFDITHISEFMKDIDFEEFVLHGILSVLLFAGALHVDINKLKVHKWGISLFATLGVILATLITGYMVYWFAGILGIGIPLVWCLVFGALISPTDPVAVLSILDKATKNEGLKSKLAGESLFNDGTGIVVFLLLLGIAASTTGSGDFSFASLDYQHIVVSLIKEIIGGVVIGLVAAIIAMYMIKSTDSFEAEIIITIALALGSYSVAEIFHVSAPIAAVIAGLFMGNKGMRIAMTDKTKEHVVTFWTLMDEILNSVLFFLIGLELVIITIGMTDVFLGFFAIIAVLIGRYVSLLACGAFIVKTGFNIKKTPILMTWAGLRGGISIALALSIPNFEYKELLMGMTYIVVVFSIIVQGLTLAPFVKYFEKDDMVEH